MAELFEILFEDTATPHNAHLAWPHCQKCAGLGGWDAEKFPYNWIKCACVVNREIEMTLEAQIQASN